MSGSSNVTVCIDFDAPASIIDDHKILFCVA